MRWVRGGSGNCFKTPAMRQADRVYGSEPTSRPPSSDSSTTASRLRPKEIAHLIYHGSTKIEDFEDIGQFGSGFLATHLLSKIIRVAGRLEDSSGFDFPLDRAGGTAEELREAMDRSWAAFEQSVEDARPAPDATTSVRVRYR